MGILRRPAPDDRSMKTRTARETQARFRTRVEKFLVSSLSWFSLLIGYNWPPEDDFKNVGRTLEPPQFAPAASFGISQT
jgi:hypothetical protein